MRLAIPASTDPNTDEARWAHSRRSQSNSTLATMGSVWASHRVAAPFSRNLRAILSIAHIKASRCSMACRSKKANTREKEDTARCKYLLRLPRRNPLNCADEVAVQSYCSGKSVMRLHCLLDEPQHSCVLPDLVKSHSARTGISTPLGSLHRKKHCNGLHEASASAART